MNQGGTLSVSLLPTSPRALPIAKHGSVWQVSAPWIDGARNDDQRKTVIGMTVLAWNMAVFPEPERWEGMSPEFAKQLWKHGEAILKKMIERKLTLYLQESRSILDYEITGSGDNLRIEVAFSLLPEEIANLNHGNQGIEAR